jgi:5-methylcytosine-specific restriction endonuclease McrA
MTERKSWTEAVKRRVAARQGYKCAICKMQLPAAWHADHKIPLHENGENSIENCQILCANCHADKTQLESIRWHERQREKVTRKSKYWDPTSTFYIKPYKPGENVAQYMNQFKLGKS